MVLRSVSFALAAASSTLAATDYTVKPFRINLSAEIPRLNAQVVATRLPAHNPVPGGEDDKWGITVSQLSNLRKEWLAFDWDAEQKRLNSYHQYTTVIDGATVHFVHEKSGKEGAIPLVITHGWPGSFNEYLPVVRPLLQSAEVTLSDGTKKNVTFDVVVPTIPGFVFSSVSPTVDGRLMTSTAALWNTLMVDVLGYRRGYAVAGSDWGGGIAWHEYDLFPQTVRAAYLNFFPWSPPDSAQVSKDNQTLSEFELFGLKRSEEWTATGSAYFYEQTTKPNTIGLALQDNAVGQLAWIGEKFYSWSDPHGQVTSKDILTGVSLYYLTRSFLTSVFQYAYNPGGFQDSTKPRKANTTAPLGYGHFKWDVGHWPRYIVEKLGNLVFYKEHERGGHYPGTDNPEDYVQDVREFLAEYFVFAAEPQV
ncbi:alpha/beta-hydrolase [Auricularia subglabra TFB-10046 SS5]|nr:alpha/beta-hydrolase [Auricularia subglabra TFB-10046 SS5]